MNALIQAARSSLREFVTRFNVIPLTNSLNKTSILVFLSFTALFTSNGVLMADANPDGSFSHSIPITLPAGTAGVMPKLSLAYDSNTGNGPLGMGWGLSGLPYMTRADQGEGIQYAGSDSYAGPGGRLLDVSGNRSVYHTENESWSKYTPHGNCGDGPCYWILQGKGGNKLYFGLSSDSRIEKPGSSSVRVWALSRLVDTHGNYYTISYSEDTANGDYYPARITYTLGNGLSSSRTVEFSYESRTDIAVDGAGGIMTSMDRRMKWITVRSAGELVRKYRMDYAYGAESGRSRLLRVQEYGNDGVSTLPAQEFQWTVAQKVSGVSTHSSGGTGSFSWAACGKRVLTGDFNGDGKEDIACGYDYGSARYALFIFYGGQSGASVHSSGGTGSFSWAACGDRVLVGDYNGDGKDDIACGYDYGSARYGLFIFYGGQNGASVHSSGGAGSFSWAACGNRFVGGDFDGDGRSDIACGYDYGSARYGLFIFYGGKNGASTHSSGGKGSFSWAACGNRFRTGDFNGDGRTDIACGYDYGSARYGLFLFYGGKNGASTHSSGGAGSFSWAACGNRVRTGDFNGDGKMDIACGYDYGSARYGLFMFYGGKSGASIHSSGGTGSFSWGACGDRVIVGDYNGDGKSDLACGYDYGSARYGLFMFYGGKKGASTHSSGGAGSFSWGACGERFLPGDFTGDGKTNLACGYDYGSARYGLFMFRSDATVGPDLMTSVKNGLGGQTFIEYLQATFFTNGDGSGPIAPTTSTCGQASGSGYGQTCGNASATSRPLVKRVSSSDGRGATYSSRYEYYNDRYFPGSQKVATGLGFEWTRAINEQSGIIKSVNYFQNQPFEGMAREQTMETSGGLLLGRTVNEFEPVRYCDDSGCSESNASSLPKKILPARSTVYRYELGNLLFAGVTEYRSYDAFGNPLVVAKLGPGGTIDDAYTVKSYINDTSKQAIGLVYRIRSCGDASCSQTLSDVITYYDNTGLGSLGSRGEITKTSEWLGGSLWANNTYGYDAHGNRISTLSPQGVSTRTVLDDQFHTYRVKSYTRDLLVLSTDYDDRYGSVLSATDYQGVTTSNSYDVFGRKSGTDIRDGGGSLLRRSTFQINLAQAATTRTVCKLYGSSFTKSLCSTSFSDGMNRTFQTKSEGPEGTVYSETEYDGVGRIKRTSAGHYAGSSINWTTHEYDGAGQNNRIIYPDGRVLSKSITTQGLVSGAFYASLTTTGGVSIKKHFDARGKRLRVTDGISSSSAGNSVDSVYDKRGSLIKKIAPGNIISTITYNDVGRRISLTEPNTGTSVYSYYDVPGQANFGKLHTARTGAVNGTSGTNTTTNEYDDKGRISRTIYGDGTSVRFTYDNTTYSYGFGKLTGAEYEADGVKVTNHYAYDATGEIKDTYERIEGPGINTAFHYGVTRDELGRDVSLSYPDGSVLSQTYQNWGGLDRIFYSSDAVNPTASDKVYASYSNYTVTGKASRVTLKNGVSSEYQYDSENGNMLRSSTQGGASGTLLDWEYEYDSRGNINRLTDNVNGALSWTYSYDSHDRLRSAVRGGGTAFTYDFDQSGNLTNKNGRAQSFQSGTHRLISSAGVSRNYSVTGNLLSTGDKSYEYGGLAKLKKVKISGKDKTVYYYRHDGTRFLKVYHKSDSESIKTYYIGSRFEIREKWTNGSLAGSQTSRYLSGLGGQKLASITSGENLNSFTALNYSGLQYALVDMMSGQSLSGLAMKFNHITMGFVTSKGAAGDLALLLLVLSLLFLTWAYFYYKLYRVKGKQRMLVPVSFVLAFSFFSASGCNSGSSLTELVGISNTVNGMVYGGKDAALNGDTTMGLPLGTYFYHGNHLGSGSLVTDAAGVEVTRVNYLPYGEVDHANSPGDDTLTHKFTGQEYDPESSLYYFNARYYDAVTGTFLSADSVVPGSGSQAQNRYMYVEGNPVNYTDPSGHWSLKKAFKKLRNAVKKVVKAIVKVHKKVWDAARNLAKKAVQLLPGYDAYQNGGWKGVFALAVSAVLMYFGIPISFSYSYNAGWGVSVCVGGSGGFGLNIGYTEKGGWFASVGYATEGGVLHGDLTYSENGGWSRSAGLSYGQNGEMFGLQANYEFGGDVTLRSTPQSIMAAYEASKQQVVYPGGESGNAAVNGQSTSLEGGQAIASDTDSTLFYNPSDGGALDDGLQSTLGKLPIIGPLVGYLTNATTRELTHAIMSGSVTNITAHSQGAIIASNALWIAGVMGYNISNISVQTYGGAATFFPPGVSVQHYVMGKASQLSGGADYVGLVIGGRALFTGNTTNLDLRNGYNSYSDDGAMNSKIPFGQVGHGWGQNGDGTRGYGCVVAASCAH